MSIQNYISCPYCKQPYMLIYAEKNGETISDCRLCGFYEQDTDDINIVYFDTEEEMIEYQEENRKEITPDKKTLAAAAPIGRSLNKLLKVTGYSKNAPIWSNIVDMIEDKERFEKIRKELIKLVYSI